MLWPIAILFVLLCLLYYLCTKNLDHWKNQNVPFEPSALPIFGHLLPVFFLHDNLGTIVRKIYRNMGSRSMRGCYLMQTPALVIRDLGLIRTVLNSDFPSSLAVLDDQLDPIMTKSAFFARGDVWKESRGLLAKSFTEEKLSSLLVLVNQVCDKHLDNTAGQTDLEMRDLFTKIMGEVVARSVFGLDDLGDFAKSIFQPGKLRALGHNVRFYFPRLADFLGISFMPRNVDEYIRNLLREPNDLLMAKTTAMFFDGYEPMIGLLSLMFYHVAGDARVQEKARLQLRRWSKKYLDHIVYETLRMYPAFGEISRVCTTELSLRGYDGLECKLRPGDVVLVPVSGIHNDIEFWQDPGSFRPERFQGGNELGFFGFGGGGPRACPGRRAAMAVAKAVLAKVIRKYSFERRERGPLKFNTGAFVSTVEGGLWVSFKPLGEMEAP